LAEKLCTNCHLVGSAQQQQPANADVPSFSEIANLEGRAAGAITARIMLPKHPMPQIPLPRPSLPISPLTSSVCVMVLGVDLAAQAVEAVMSALPPLADIRQCGCDFWALRTGQFEDLEGAAYRALEDDPTDDRAV
jgi:hypothetical protein